MEAVEARLQELDANIKQVANQLTVFMQNNTADLDSRFTSVKTQSDELTEKVKVEFVGQDQ